MQFATTSGTALAGSDFVSKSGTLTWAAGDTSPKTFNVVIKGDPTVDDPQEFLFINLTNAVNATIVGSAPQASGDILNGTTGIAISNVTATEGNVGTKTFNFTVSRTGLATGATSVKFATANGVTNPATAGSDYVGKTGTITWAPNDTANKTVSITVNGDTTVEKDETFFVNLTNPVGGTIIHGQGLGTILNDDTSISINNVSVTKGNSGTKTLTFTVTRSGVSPGVPVGAASVKFATANGTTNPATAGSDYVAKTGTISWAANDTAAKTISITINGDTIVEKDETFFVNLSSASGATIARGQGLGTILNDDTAPVTLQGEAATLAGGTVVASSNTGFTGTGYAQFGGTGSSATFTNITRRRRQRDADVPLRQRVSRESPAECQRERHRCRLGHVRADRLV